MNQVKGLKTSVGALLASLVGVITLAIGTPSLAHEGCEHAMESGDGESSAKKSEITVIGSGRNADMQAAYEDAFQEFFGPKGVLSRMGLEVAPQVARVVAGREMDLLASQGRHAVGHWSEGAQIVRQVSSNSGVIYEFVASQSRFCQVSYYRDTLAFDEQVSIIAHVAGHDLFAIYTRMAQKRDYNAVGRSLQLYRLIETLYRDQNREEVSGWYDVLKMLSMFQDMSRGTYEPLDRFAPGSGEKIPKHPTANVLQAMIANLPPNTPSWKREMAIQFEAIHRHYSGSAPTKIMNEGFATLMQELLPAHTKFSTMGHLFAWSSLSSGVVRGGYSNPYKLGLEAWRRVRARFNARPENRGLDRFELDKRFMHYAVTDVIGVFDDYSFLWFALDLEWARESNLALTRELEPWEEKDIPPPPEGRFRQPAQHLVDTRDPARIIRKLQREVADLRLRMPRIVLKDLYFERRTMLFGFEDEFGLNIPLEPQGMLGTLLMLAFHWQRNASLETILVTTDGLPLRVVIEVTPVGEVQVHTIDRKSALPQIAEVYQRLIREFQEYQDLGIESPSARLLPIAAFETTVGEIAAGVANGVPSSLMMSAPTAARAVAEYHFVLAKRLGAALRNALFGKAPLRRRGGGVSVDALPVIPALSYDFSALDHIAQAQGPSQPDFLKLQVRIPQPASLLKRDTSMWTSSHAIKSNAAADPKSGSPVTKWTDPSRPDDGKNLGPSDGDEGTIHWGEGRPRRNQGDGEGEGDGEGNDPGQGPQPGQGSQDPTAVTIPPDLYARLLSTIVELPNLNPKHGPAEAYTRRRHGTAVGRSGELAFDHIQKNAYFIGRQRLLRQGETERAKSAKECIVEGLKYLRDQDWRIVSRRPDVKPDISAVMFFLVDASGSMNSFKATVKHIVYDLQAILSRKYQRIEFRFIMFDIEATTFKTLQDFMRAWKGGGTSYMEGLNTAVKLQEEFPRAQYDRYVTMIGDLDDFGDAQPTVDRVKNLVDQSEFVGTMHTRSFGDSQLAQGLKQLADSEKWVGFVTVENPQGYFPAILRKLFKNPE